MVKSWSAMMSLTMSRIETMPTTRPSSTTGRWRMFFSVMRAMHSRVLARGVTQITLAVMISSTRVVSEERPLRIDLAGVVALREDARPGARRSSRWRRRCPRAASTLIASSTVSSGFTDTIRGGLGFQQFARRSSSRSSSLRVLVRPALPPSHVRVVRAAAAFGHDPVDVLASDP